MIKKREGWVHNQTEMISHTGLLTADS
jgi:hypothetical protein